MQKIYSSEEKSFVLQKKLAQERTILANERTTLAYIRTGLAAFLLGFGLMKLFENSISFVRWGIFSIGIGFFFLMLGLILHVVRKQRIKKHLI